MMNKITIGNLERCDLQELGIRGLEVRVDTGAKTSSLHVDNIKRIDKNGDQWVRFDIHPDVYDIDQVVECEAVLKSTRKIKSSNGASERRYIIKTLFGLGKDSWPIEITLSDRAEMSYRMLLGRQGMANRVLVDPSQTFLIT
ncbi:MAG: hypothetical protein ACI9FR_001517 [Cryomorphaceae bacterium]|jgi:hypothetical protein